MSDFAVAAELEAVVSQGSMRDARSTIEDELGDVTVDVDASASNQLARPDGGSGRGRGQSMSRSLLSDQSQQLSAAADHLQENLGLNEERNDILLDILEAQEMTAREDGGGGNLLSSLGGGAIGLAGGGLLLAGLVGRALLNVNWGQIVSDAIPDIDIGPGDVIAGAGAAVTAPALIVSKASVEAADLIEDAASIEPADLVDGAGAAITAPALVASKVTVEAADLVADTVTITEEDILGEPEGSPTPTGSEHPAAQSTIDATQEQQRQMESMGYGDPTVDPSGSGEGTGTGESDPLAGVVVDDEGAGVPTPADVDQQMPGTTQTQAFTGPLPSEGPNEEILAGGALLAGGLLFASGVGAPAGAGLAAKGAAGLGAAGLVGAAATGSAAADETGGNQTSASENESARGTTSTTNITVDQTVNPTVDLRSLEDELDRRDRELRQDVLREIERELPDNATGR